MSFGEATVGFLGLGNLGLGMAIRLAETGFDVVGFDPSDRRLAALQSEGGRRGSLEEVFACAIVCVATPDEAPVASYLADDAASPAARTVVLHSTVLPQRARDLEGALAARDIRLVEAPVSGGPERARRGELTLMLGGSSEAIAGVDPVLAALATRRFVLGDIGAASATKLANQLMMFAAVGVAHEALALTDVFGVEREAALDAISASTGDTWVGRNWRFFDGIVADYDANGTPADQRPWRKDLREFIDSADAAGLDAPLAHGLVGTVGDRIELSARNTEEGEVS
jgi:3-hydroxyisobutyrate dehydrogenase-like beta-hydroxyacid dehydrogenase